MNPSANVQAISALSDFRAALINFSDQAKQALSMLDMDIRRTFDFLDEQLGRWQAAARKAEDGVFQAKTELARRKMMKIGDRTPDTSEQEETLAHAKARLEFAQEKLAATQRWLRDLPNELIDYQGPSRQLQGFLEADVPRMTAFLDQKIAALEAYLNVGK
ncbi:MAG: hypothetical protein L0215_22590 [Gemmataceae bacterium]|nr:hypothetical protein [Gemmataceae bacterium]